MAVLSAIERARNRRPIIYATREAHAAILAGRSFPNAIWIRSPGVPPGDEPRWSIWQFADGARVPGIPADVDLDGFPGDVAALKKL